MNWVVGAFISGVIGGVLGFMAKYLKVSVAAFLSIQFLIAGLILLPFVKFSEIKQNWMVFLLLGILLVLSAQLGVAAFREAPNPSYSTSIYTIVNVVVIYLLSFFVLGIGVTPLKLVGATLGIAGAILLVI